MGPARGTLLEKLSILVREQEKVMGSELINKVTG